MRLSPAPLACVVLALLSVLACDKKKEPTPAPAPAPAPMAPAQTGTGPRKHVGPVGEPMNPMEQLTFEAQRRPTGVLKVEDVVAALKAAGVELEAPHQVAAKRVRAAYCVAGATKAGTGVTICEFTDEAAATAGRDFSMQAFGPAKNRLFSVRRGALLTVTTTVEPPESDVEGKKIVEAFEKL